MPGVGPQVEGGEAQPRRLLRHLEVEAEAFPAELPHLPEHGPLPPRLGGGPAEAGLHRKGVGVVGVVDEDHAAHLPRLHAPRGEGEAGEPFRHLFQGKAQDLGRRQGRERPVGGAQPGVGNAHVKASVAEAAFPEAELQVPSPEGALGEPVDEEVFPEP